MKFSIALVIGLGMLTSLANAEMVINHVRVKALIPGQSITAAYFQIENTGDSAAHLIAVRSDAAAKIKMHGHAIQDGMMSMIALDRVEIAAHSSLEFVEGERHLMMSGLDLSAFSKQEIAMEFEFEDGNLIAITGRVEQLLPSAHHQH